VTGVCIDGLLLGAAGLLAADHPSSHSKDRNHHEPYPLESRPRIPLAVLATAASASCGAGVLYLDDRPVCAGHRRTPRRLERRLRIESVSQSRLRSGTSNIDASQVTGEEAIERHTKNLNVVTTLAMDSMTTGPCRAHPGGQRDTFMT